MIRLSCKNNNVWAITEDQLISSSWNTGDRDINLVYSIDKLLQEKVYIFMRYRMIKVYIINFNFHLQEREHL